ncbi:MAG: hypothetical protein E7478_00025 [Ruminococcaceae bacterium]|nr:hypothetical protein [Oscillospiraceae bacterium]
MGRFSTTVHIKYNTDAAGFKNLFREIMKKRGFVLCDQDEAVLSYALASGASGWVTLASEAYRDDLKIAQGDLKYIAKELRANSFSVEVVDSDFAVLTLNNGDTVIVGDGSCYGIEAPSRGDRKYWEPLLADGMTWQRFSETAQKDSVFVEDTLSEFADIIGVSPELICADPSELSDNENAVQLYFKKAEAKEKAMSLNAAFKKVFGEALEPLGFKLIKSKYPYFVRVVSDEIIHYVTVANERADGRGDNGVKYKCFNVFCGVSTVYKGDIDFEENPTRFLSSFINSLSEIYTRTHWSNLDMKYRASIMRFYYNPTSTQSLLGVLSQALVVALKDAIPVIDQAVTLEKCMDYFELMEHRLNPLLDGGGEGLLCTKLFSADEYVTFMDKYWERELEDIKRKLSITSDPKRIESFETRIKCIASEREECKEKCYRLFTEPELQEKAPAELARRKKENTEKLRSYGLDI